MHNVAEVLDWLLDSDPALRWQVQRDLCGAPETVWTSTRADVATTGYGARLLELQDDDGQWAGGAYFPRDFDTLNNPAGQPWTATTWSLNALRDWGVAPASLGGTAAKLEENSRWEYDDLPYWGGEVDCCINAFTLANGAWLGADVALLTRWFVEHQCSDGGWNCEWAEGSTRSSFHSTLNSLNGLLAYEQIRGAHPELRAAREKAHEYLLSRRLMYRLSTNESVGSWTTEFSYPFRWRYNALAALDYFRAASLHDDTPIDPRLADAANAVRSARQPDGTWLQGSVLPGEVWFDVDVTPGQPSQWLTFYGIRALSWWNQQAE